jgi:hypothetical protein
MSDHEQDSTRPSAFVSYAQTSPEWQKAVFKFATALRSVGGIDAELDLYHASDHQRWANFGPKLIEESVFTLIAVDAAYKRRWEGKEVEGVGAGAAREAAAIKTIFDRSQDEFARRIKVVLLPGTEVDQVPDDLRGSSERFLIPSFDEAGLEALLRSLWGKPAYPKPALGPIPVLPPQATAELDDQGEKRRETTGADAKHEGSTAAEQRDRIERRLDELSKKANGEQTISSSEESKDTDELQREVMVLKASLEALTESDEKTRDSRYEDATLSPALKPFLAGLEDLDDGVRFSAMTALGDRLEPALLPTFKSLLGDRDSYIRQYALEYYVKLAGKEAVPALISALDDPDSGVRFSAMTALGDHLEPSMLEKIRSLLDDRDSYIRQYALEYYSKLIGS